MSETPFIEICYHCNKEKEVTTDTSSSYDNPTFICKDCESAREQAETQYNESVLQC